MTKVRHAYHLLTSQVAPHENAEGTQLYPVVNRLLGGEDPTARMSRAHAEIAHQITQLGRLLDDIGNQDPDEADVADLRRMLYGLDAILRLHTAQEDETYLSLGDTPRSRPRALVLAEVPRCGRNCGRGSEFLAVNDGSAGHRTCRRAATAGGDDMPPDSRDELFAREAAVGGRARRTLLCGHGVRVCRVS